MLNTGMGSSESSIKLSTKLLLAHREFCQRTNKGKPGTTISRTQSAFQYVRDAFEYHHSWLETYIARKENAMNFVSLEQIETVSPGKN